MYTRVDTGIYIVQFVVPAAENVAEQILALSPL